MALVQPDVASKRQVSETALLFLHAQIVDYNIRGNGAKFYDKPSVSKDKEKGESNENEARDSDSVAGLQLSAKRRRLEALGQDIGRRLAERHSHYRERLEKDLDKVKFLCKDFWESTFRKQIDVLRTNHRGLYVLTDNNFQWLANVCPPRNKPNDGVSVGDHVDDGTLLAAEDFVVLPCGVICGALTRLGLRCRVTADLYSSSTGSGYRVSFNIQLIQ